MRMDENFALTNSIKKSMYYAVYNNEQFFNNVFDFPLSCFCINGASSVHSVHLVVENCDNYVLSGQLVDAQ
jgi:hypothetical protein